MSIAKPDGSKFIPTLVLVGTRLGVDRITPVYWEALKATLQMPQSIGIAGYVGNPVSLSHKLTIDTVVDHLPRIILLVSKAHISSTWIHIKLDQLFPCQMTPRNTHRRILTHVTRES